jgi:hypothetical protein
MSKINQKVVAGTPRHTKAYENVFGENIPSPYIDLGNFAKLLEKIAPLRMLVKRPSNCNPPSRRQSSRKARSNQKGSNGISIYFPFPDFPGGRGGLWNLYQNGRPVRE